MRERIVLCGILTKRLLCKKSFYILLALFCLSAIWMQRLEQSGENVVDVVIYAENRMFWEQAFAEDMQDGGTWIQFYFAEDEEQLKRDVVTGKAECGYVLTEDLQKKFDEDDWYWAVTVYESAGSMLAKTINETVYSRIFYVISTKWYEGYIAKNMEEETAEEVLEQGVILEVLEKYLESDSTFQVETRYVRSGNGVPGTETALPNVETVQPNVETVQPDAELFNVDDSSAASGGSIFPVRGIIAAGMYLCALLGALEVLCDRRKGYFKGKPQGTVVICSIGLPICLMAAAGYVVLLATGCHRGGMAEAGFLFWYVFLLTGYGFFLQWIVRKENLLAGLIPFLFMGSLVCTPVFADLGRMVPLLAMLGKVFPATYYLGW